MLNRKTIILFMLASIFASSCSNEEVIENGTSASAPVNG